MLLDALFFGERRISLVQNNADISLFFPYLTLHVLIDVPMNHLLDCVNTTILYLKILHRVGPRRCHKFDFDRQSPLCFRAYSKKS